MNDKILNLVIHFILNSADRKAELRHLIKKAYKNNNELLEGYSDIFNDNFLNKHKENK